MAWALAGLAWDKTRDKAWVPILSSLRWPRSDFLLLFLMVALGWVQWLVFFFLFFREKPGVLRFSLLFSHICLD
jgi:hypothetical protein